MPSLREPSVLYPTKDASTSTRQLELGRSGTSPISKPNDGLPESAGSWEIVHAIGIAEADGQHG